MPKWLNVNAAPGANWNLDDAVDLEELEADFRASRTIVLPLKGGGLVIVRPELVGSLAFGDSSW